MADSGTRSKLRRRASLIIGLAFLAYIGYFYYSMATGKARMTAVCGEIKPGMTVDQVVHLAEEYDLRPRALTAETKLAYLAEVRTMGRHACRVEFDGGVVTATAYNFAD
jgi:hypothetical protein